MAPQTRDENGDGGTSELPPRRAAARKPAVASTSGRSSRTRKVGGSPLPAPATALGAATAKPDRAPAGLETTTTPPQALGSTATEDGQSWVRVSLWLVLVGLLLIPATWFTLPRRASVPDPPPLYVTIATDASVQAVRLTVHEGQSIVDKDGRHLNIWTMDMQVTRPVEGASIPINVTLEGTRFDVTTCQGATCQARGSGTEGEAKYVSQAAWPDKGTQVDQTFTVQAAQGSFGWESNGRKVRGAFPRVTLTQGKTNTATGFLVDYSLFFSGAPSQIAASEYTWTPRTLYIDPVGPTGWRLSDPRSSGAAVSDTAQAQDLQGESEEAATTDDLRTFAAGVLAGLSGSALMAALQKFLERGPLGRQRITRTNAEKVAAR